MCPVDEREFRALLGTVEDDFGAVGRDVEVADDKRCWQLGKQALGTGLQVDDPEIPVVEVSAQNDQRLAIRRERHPPCTARQDQGGQGIGSAVPAGVPQRKGRTDAGARRYEERARANLAADPLIPSVAAAQFALIEPNLDSRGAKGVANPLGCLGILRCVA